MICLGCKSNNVNVETASNVKSNGGQIPFWYWISFAWMIDLVLYCCIVGFFGLTIAHSFSKTTTKIETYAVCQDCGKTWRIK